MSEQTVPEYDPDYDTDKKYDCNFFPGCTISNRLPFIEKSSRLVFEKLGVVFHDKPFGCCPDPVGIRSIDMESWFVLAARNLAIAEEDNYPMIIMCNGCAETLVSAVNELRHDEKVLKEVNDELKKVDRKYKTQVRVYHFVDALYRKIGTKNIKKMVERPLENINLAVHIGCHFFRPESDLGYKNPERKQYSQKIMEALGANVIDYEEKDLCCGYAASLQDNDISLGILYEKLKSIKEAGDIDAIVVNCPTCFQQFENGQRLVKRKYNLDVNIPILYVTEAMALAFGFDPKELGFKYHRVKLRNFLKEKGFTEKKSKKK